MKRLPISLTIACVGSRGNYTQDQIRKMNSMVSETHILDHLISGGAYGADTIFINHAKQEHRMYTVVPVHATTWREIGRSAGVIRTAWFLEMFAVDCAIIAYDGVSRGTKQTMLMLKDRRISSACLLPNGKVRFITFSPGSSKSWIEDFESSRIKQFYTWIRNPTSESDMV